MEQNLQLLPPDLEAITFQLCSGCVVLLGHKYPFVQTRRHRGAYGGTPSVMGAALSVIGDTSCGWFHLPPWVVLVLSPRGQNSGYEPVKHLVQVFHTEGHGFLYWDNSFHRRYTSVSSSMLATKMIRGNDAPFLWGKVGLGIFQSRKKIPKGRHYRSL